MAAMSSLSKCAKDNNSRHCGKHGRTGSLSSEFGAATAVPAAWVTSTVAEEGSLAGGVGPSGSIADAATGMVVVRMEGTVLKFFEIVLMESIVMMSLVLPGKAETDS